MEDRLPIKSYAKNELAHLYNPMCPYHSAMKIFRKWITVNASLMNELEQTNYSPKSKIFSPRQVEIIVRHLGEP